MGVSRVVFAAAAYLGDVAPFVEPANRLADGGHHVAFVVPRGFHSVLGGERFELVEYPLDFSPTGMRSDGTHDRLMRHPWLNQVRLGRYWMRRGFIDDPDAATRALSAALRGADVLVTHPTFGSATVPIARHLGVPVVVGQLFPMMMPTAAHGPPFGLANPDFRAATVNRAAWKAFATASGTVLYDGAINERRQALGQPPLRGNALLAWTAAERTVVLVSRHYFGDPPSDWHHWPLAGFSSWPGPTGATVDDKVDEFIAGGDPPVLVCLGTSAATVAGAAFATIARGLQQLELRPLLLVGHAANLQHLDGVDGAFEFAPVPSVAARCAAAVVSGALGTLAAALSAGIPVVVLPQLFDQIWHGHRVQQLGVGTMVTRASQVPAAVASVLADPTYRARAEEFGRQLRAEDGAGALVDAVHAVS